MISNCTPLGKRIALRLHYTCALCSWRLCRVIRSHGECRHRGLDEYRLSLYCRATGPRTVPDLTRGRNIMRLLIDTKGVQFRVAGAAKPKPDYKDKDRQAATQDGRPIWTVRLDAVDAERETKETIW